MVLSLRRSVSLLNRTSQCDAVCVRLNGKQIPRVHPGYIIQAKWLTIARACFSVESTSRAGVYLEFALS